MESATKWAVLCWRPRVMPTQAEAALLCWPTNEWAVSTVCPLPSRRARPAAAAIAVWLARGRQRDRLRAAPSELAPFPVLVAIYTAASLTRGRVTVVTAVGTSLLALAGWVITDVGHVDEFWP